ncbi:retrovirus-related pol polyprotein from transposon TNT 1-94, partial [Tanacetum coccineum]
MEQFQVNTKFLNSLPRKWSKFVTDVKLVKDLHTSNFDQLHAYLEQHELHANEVHLMRERNQRSTYIRCKSVYDIISLQYLSVFLQQSSTSTIVFTIKIWINSTQSTLLISLSITNSIPSFIHSTITYISVSNESSNLICSTSFLLPIIEELRTSSNPRNQATIQDGGLPCNKFRGDKGKIILVQHIRAMLLVQGEIQQVDKQELLNATTAKIEEQLAFLADPGMPGGESRKEIVENVVHTPSATTIVQDGSSFDSETVALQTEDLDTYDSDYDDLSTAQAVLMANISNCGSDVISEVQLDSRMTRLQGLWGMVTISWEMLLSQGYTTLRGLDITSSKTKSWLWHRRLSHLNFGTLNKLDKDGLARGIPRLKFQKDHLCLACALGKSKKSSHQPKAEDTNQEKLYLLHMDLCGPMRVANNGTGFVNQTLCEWYENVGIMHQTFVARTPQQNGVVERENQTLKEAARTMLIFSKALLFLWTEGINTACYTQNKDRSLIRLWYNKTLYELIQDKKPDLSFLHVFGSLCYPINDHEDMGKFNAKSDIGIFVSYAPAKKAFRIYNRRTRIITETIHVTFDELTAMASKQFSSGPGLHYMTPATSNTGLVSNPVSQQPCIPLIKDEWDR